MSEKICIASILVNIIRLLEFGGAWRCRKGNIRSRKLTNQTIQWPIWKGQKCEQWSTKTTQKVNDWATPTSEQQEFRNIIDIYRHLLNLQQKLMWKPIEMAFKSVDFEHTCWRSSKKPWTLNVKSVSSKRITPATFL